ncbi:hypothetical protein [Thalassobius sp. Cn5-15]|uniref:hypothetical protein n=1 Tax=Thalassobius sp. Cn5-15 TaxID=2917763 RepID=UPI001EF28A41|nr:hypothetical protein [Thalassobius sp. Cn5-15]MCG7494258.1 hypothetical protein [Thalassobius sp. Cn5-15]
MPTACRFPKPRLTPQRAALFALCLSVTNLFHTAASANDAPPAEVKSALPAAAELGAAKVRWFGLPIYDGRLFTTKAAAFDWQKPFALELTYQRGFSQEQLLTATNKELIRMEGRLPDQSMIVEKLTQCYRTVAKGDRFVAFGARKDRITFLFNGQRSCDLDHPDVRKRVMSIWLSDQSRDPALSRKLRGEE